MRLPLTVESGLWQSGHCQGMQVNVRKGEIYFSFTTAFVRMTLDGKLLGSVEGLRGHLGCIALQKETGLVYASLEYKNDEIGKGILELLGDKGKISEGFYIAVFDPEKITQKGMKPKDAMKAVFLKKPTEDYGFYPDGGLPHRYGASGIDGVAFGPMFGEEGGKNYLFTSYGIYGDTNRLDNDHQVILKYDTSEWDKYLKPIDPENMHVSGPEQPDGVYFAYTGNTTYGIQNLEYDEYTKSYMAAVYKGKKERFPNYSMFLFDALKAPVYGSLKGLGGEMGNLLTLGKGALTDPETGITGYNFPYGTTGLASLGNGAYYVSEDEKTPEGWRTTVRRYEFDEKLLLVPAKE